MCECQGLKDEVRAQGIRSATWRDTMDVKFKNEQKANVEFRAMLLDEVSSIKDDVEGYNEMKQEAIGALKLGSFLVKLGGYAGIGGTVGFLIKEAWDKFAH